MGTPGFLALRKEVTKAFNHGCSLIRQGTTAEGLTVLSELFSDVMETMEELDVKLEKQNSSGEGYCSGIPPTDDGHEQRTHEFNVNSRDTMERTSQLLNEGYDLDIAVENCIRKVNADLNWDSIIGQKDAKEALRQTLEYPHRFSWFYRGKTVPPQGVLLYGPPGVAKTKMAEVAASVSGSVLVEVRASSIRSKFYGESEKFIKALFAKVSGMEKAIIFIDEMDDLLSSRDHQSSSIGDGIINEFLVEMTGNIPLEERKFVIIGATNFPHKIDIAIRRRFQKQVRLHMPTQVDRCDMFQTFLKDAMHNLEKTDFQLLAKLSDGFTGDDILNIVQAAIMKPLTTTIEESIYDPNSTEFKQTVLSKKIELVDLKLAIQLRPKTVTGAYLAELDKFQPESKHSNININKQRKSSKGRLTDAVLRMF